VTEQLRPKEETVRAIQMQNLLFEERDKGKENPKRGEERKGKERKQRREPGRYQYLEPE
jgi:hypothetical protein